MFVWSELVLIEVIYKLGFGNSQSDALIIAKDWKRRYIFQLQGLEEEEKKHIHLRIENSIANLFALDNAKH